MLDFCLEHVLEITLPVVVAVLMKACKKAFSDFFSQNHAGVRILPFMPILLGTPLGLFLTNYEFPSRLLVGAALGGLSHYIYKLITVSLTNRIKIAEKIERKSLDLNKVRKSLSGGTDG